MRDQEAINRKISATMKGRAMIGPGTKGLKFPTMLRERWDKRLFEQLGHKAKRLRVIKEQDGKCLWCGISDWRYQPIVLEVDHIDGNRGNDCRGNLRALCPNCHSQTDTDRFRGRKHSEKTKKRLQKILHPTRCG